METCRFCLQKKKLFQSPSFNPQIFVVRLLGGGGGNNLIFFLTLKVCPREEKKGMNEKLREKIYKIEAAEKKNSKKFALNFRL